ncbi:hypothetical protein [Ekhidna sp.]|uniref:hypothetical protein n=1 Tax=Ekhidna sp. TaxID=2608089 RepID=UPI003299E318
MNRINFKFRNIFMIPTALIKELKVWSLLLLSLSMLLTQSCVSEDELDLPTEVDTTGISESVAIVSVLRAIEHGSLREEGCVQFLYPLKLQFNNNLSITVSDFIGLSEVAINSTIDQHINAIQFPFIATKGGVIKNIENEQEFINLLDECEILTLRDEFDPFFTQCFDLIYPITMLDIDSNQVVIDSQSAYFSFELEQGFDKQPKFSYPIELLDYASNTNISVETPFELFEIFDTCEKCPQLFFRIDTVQVNRFLFVADFEQINDIAYDWYINDDKIETDGGAAQGDNRLIETFASGEYEICIKTSLPEGDCFSGTEYCQIISVDACPFVSYVTEEINSNTFEFIANFEAKDLIDFTWAIYSNDVLIFSELEDSGGDNKLQYQFSAGTYEVCLEAEIEECPQVLRFCTEVLIE